MYISENTAYNIYSISDTSKTAKSNPASPRIPVASDVIEISPAAQKQADIAAFLKDKPVSAYKYDQFLKYEPEQADSFIGKLMESYGKDPIDFQREYKIEYLDQWVKSQGCQTAEDVRAGLKEFYNKLYLGDLESSICNTPELKDAEKEDGKTYGDMVSNGFYYSVTQHEYNIEKEASTWLQLERCMTNASLYQDKKIDKDTGVIWILPNNSDKWVTREEFINKCPDYESSYTMRSDTTMAMKSGSETLFKYTENYISNLSEEEKAYIRDNNLVANPAYRKLNIKGMEELAVKNYTDFSKYRKYHIETNEDYENIINGTYNETILNFFTVEYIENLRASRTSSLKQPVWIDEKETNKKPLYEYNTKTDNDNIGPINSNGEPLTEKQKTDIDSFLDGKPFIEYRYNKLITYTPKDAFKFIEQMMKEYNTDIGSGSLYKKSDDYAISQGCQSAEEIEYGVKKYALTEQMKTIRQFLGATNRMLHETSYEQWITDYTLIPGYGTKAEPEESGITWRNLSNDGRAISYIKERDIDENGRVMILPHNSNIWVSKEDFIKACPDYRYSNNIIRELETVRNIGEDALFNYVEDFIAGLSEEDKAIVKESGLFTGPNYKQLNVKGLNELIV